MNKKLILALSAILVLFIILGLAFGIGGKNTEEVTAESIVESTEAPAEETMPGVAENIYEEAFAAAQFTEATVPQTKTTSSATVPTAPKGNQKGNNDDTNGQIEEPDDSEPSKPQTKPTTPSNPADSDNPEGPTDSEQSGNVTEPSAPSDPADSDNPEGPTDSEQSGNVTEPSAPTDPTDPVIPINPAEESEYEKFINLSPVEQQAYMESFKDIAEFFNWYNNAKAEYDAENSAVSVGNGKIDLDDYS